MQNKISAMLGLYNSCRNCKKTMLSSNSTDLKLIDTTYGKFCLRKCTKHASLEDLKHRLKAKCMYKAGSRSNCDNQRQ